MSGFYVIGEKKVRPGIYKRVTNTGGSTGDGTRDGICVAVVTGNWGPINEVNVISNGDDYTRLLGTSGSGYDVVTEMFAGGANSIVICRVGTGGKEATLTLKDASSSSADAITVTAKYVGARELSITVKDSLTEDGVKNIIIFDGTKKLESFSISSAEEITAAVEALSKSSYVVATKKASGTGKLALVSQAKLAGGSNPTVTTASYSAGFDAVEAEMSGATTVLAVDTNDVAVHALLSAFAQRTYESGCYPICCIGEPSSVDIDTRMQHAQAFDAEQMVYVLNGWYDATGSVHDGYIAAARIAGMIAAIASNDSLTHKSIQNAVSLAESMTNSQIVRALKSGCLVISTSSAKQVRVEKAINTLTTLTADKDAGWKKIRRVKTRYELMYRVDAAVDGLTGSINKDDDGRAAIIAAGQEVLDTMAGEQKLLPGAEMILDSSNPPEGDSAWFLINPDDIDSFEIGYIAYGYRFAAEIDETE